MRKRVQLTACILESRWGWMPFIWKTVPSKIHTNGALHGGKIVGPFPPWGPLSTRRQKEPMSSVCNFFNPAKDRAVRHTRRPCPEDTQQAVALTQMPSPSCSSKHLPWICKQKQPALKGLSGEGKYGCDRRIPLGHCWAEVSFKVTGRRGPGSTRGFLQGSWPAEWKRGHAWWPQTCPQGHCKKPCWVWVKRIGEQTWFLDLKLLGWATLVTASVRERPSSWPAAITIQLTFMLSLRTPFWLTHNPQLTVCISWTVNSWMFSKLPPPAMKEGLNEANSHPPPRSWGRWEWWGISKQLQELLPSPQRVLEGRATRSNSQQHTGPQGDFWQVNAPGNNS